MFILPVASWHQNSVVIVLSLSFGHLVGNRTLHLLLRLRLLIFCKIICTIIPKNVLFHVVQLILFTVQWYISFNLMLLGYLMASIYHHKLQKVTSGCMFAQEASRTVVIKIVAFSLWQPAETWSCRPCRKCFGENRKCPGSTSQASKNSRKLLYSVEWTKECSMAVAQQVPGTGCRLYRIYR